MTIYLRSLKPHCYAILQFCERGRKKIKNYVKKLRKNLQNTICSSYLCIGFQKRHESSSFALRSHRVRDRNIIKKLLVIDDQEKIFV